MWRLQRRRSVASLLNCLTPRHAVVETSLLRHALGAATPSLSGHAAARSHGERPTPAPAPGVEDGQPTRPAGTNAAAARGSVARDPLSIPARSRPASGSCWSTTSARCGRAAPACSRWTATTSRSLGPRRRGARDWSSAASSTSSWSTSTCRRSRGWRSSGRRSTPIKDTIVVVMTGNPSVTTSIEALRAGAWDYLPEAVLGDPSPGAHRPRLARGHGRSREARDLRLQLLQQHGHSDKITLIGISPLFRKAVELARKVAPHRRLGVHQRRERHRQGSDRPVHPPAQPPRQAGSWCRSTAPRCPSRCSNPRCSAIGRAPSPAPTATSPACWRPPTAGRCSSTSSPRCRCRSRPSCCASSRTAWCAGSGSEQQDAVVDVRFISATNRDPQEAVDAGMLRDDLFYRLRVVPITLPPLRKRPEDIPLLANHFLTHYWERHRQMRGPDARSFSDASIEFLRSRPWRGNVRELQNVIEHVAVLAEPDQVDPAGRHSDLRRRPRNGPAEHVAAQPGCMDEPIHLAKDRLVAALRKGVPHRASSPAPAATCPRRRARQHRPHDALPADGEARIPPRRDAGAIE